MPSPAASTIPDIASDFGLIGWLEDQRVRLPLKGIEARFRVCGGLVEVELDQIYHQDNRSALNCQYLFPLPATAAIYRCELHINDRLLVAKAMEREDAIELVNEKKAAGHRTALVESERENLFTLSLGNVQPGDLIVVRLAYLQHLSQLGAMRSVEIPLCPGIRYIPGNSLLRGNVGPGPENDTDQVRDASRITTPRIDQLHPDAAYVDIQGRIDAETVRSGTIESPSHELITTRAGADLEVTLRRLDHVPDRAFAIRWHEIVPAQFQPRGWQHRHDGYTYALLELRAPKSPRQNAALPLDIYFMLDRSGSMSGRKWDKAVEALRTSLERLEPTDRVWLTVFESAYKDYDVQLASPAKMLGDQSLWDGLATGARGGTELAPALQHVIAQTVRLASENPAQLLLITDAQVGNDDAILRLAIAGPKLKIHCFGVDVALNDALLEALARQSGGSFHSLSPFDDIAARVSELAAVIRQPVLTQIAIPAGWELADRTIPPLHSEQIHFVSLRHRGQTAAITLTGRDHADQPVTFTFAPTTTKEPAPYLFWCRRQLDQLQFQGRTEEAVRLSEESNLLCRATAFVAWDPHEKVALADGLLVQPAQMVTGDLLCASASAWGTHYPQNVSYCYSTSRRVTALYSMGEPSPSAAHSLAAVQAARCSVLLSIIFTAMDRHLAARSPLTPALREKLDQQVNQPGSQNQLSELLKNLEPIVERLHSLEQKFDQLTKSSNSSSVITSLHKLRLRRVEALIERVIATATEHLLAFLKARGLA